MIIKTKTHQNAVKIMIFVLTHPYNLKQVKQNFSRIIRKYDPSIKWEVLLPTNQQILIDQIGKIIEEQILSNKINRQVLPCISELCTQKRIYTPLSYWQSI